MLLDIFPTLLIIECLVLAVSVIEGSNVTAVDNKATSKSNNITCTKVASVCKDGVLIPMWSPQENLSDNERAIRASLYMFAMIYMFLGVSLISDRFVTGIEAITAKEKEVIVEVPGGERTVVRVHIWNETVANLTLMALGSSAPEIMLSIIEICGNKFEAGDLGPSTIVGSAAYNLFVITAICVYVVPQHESRHINQLNVFFVTATWSVVAYLWLYIILLVFSEGIVEVWEAALTFIFFPLTVLTAYITDREMLSCKSKDSSKDIGVTEMAVGKTNPESRKASTVLTLLEQQRKDAIETIRGLRDQNPEFDIHDLVSIVECNDRIPRHRSKAYYRARARERKRKLTPKKHAVKEDKNAATLVSFSTGKCKVAEDVGTFNLIVKRTGGNMWMSCHVDYKTTDITAKAGLDYIPISGTLTFKPDQRENIIPITIIDDEIFEPNEFFLVILSNTRLSSEDGKELKATNSARLGLHPQTMITIVDNDHPGVFHFVKKRTTVPETVEALSITVCRSMGVLGIVKVPYHIVEGTAQLGTSYEVFGNELIFESHEFEKFINVQIKNTESYKKKEHFTLVLDEPIPLKHVKGKKHKKHKEAAEEGGEEEDNVLQVNIMPKLGEYSSYQVTIKECDAFKKAVDVLMKSSLKKTPWNQQFIEAITVFTSYDYKEGELKLPTFYDYFSHFAILSWKIMAAFVPPTYYLSGWACFSVSLLIIGVQTALIGDLASSFGCTVGLKDALTAISFVALGTSLPDTFASKFAAINDRYADAAIGNVTGSNAVNVFMGLGVAWTIAAIYHSYVGDTFIVPPGDLATSVAVYCGLSLVALTLIVARRHPAIGGELGGPFLFKIFSTFFLISIWFLYLTISTLVIYCFITPL